MAQHPKEFLESLSQGADPRKERSLRLIFDICEEQQKRGSKDYSVATIGRLSNEAGGPSTASIRNKTGEHYRALIKAYADFVGGNKRKVAETKQSEADLILEGISDPVLKSRLGLLLAELESTRAQLLAARHLANQNSVVNLADYSSHSPSSKEEVEILPPAPTLSTLELRAIKSAISDKTLDHWGWHIDESGRVLTDSGQQVFGAGFATAINKIISSTED